MPETRFITCRTVNRLPPPPLAGIVRAKRPIHHPSAVVARVSSRWSPVHCPGPSERFPAPSRGTRNDRASPRRRDRVGGGFRLEGDAFRRGGGVFEQVSICWVDRPVRTPKITSDFSACLDFPPKETVRGVSLSWKIPFFSCAFLPVSLVSYSLIRFWSVSLLNVSYSRTLTIYSHSYFSVSIDSRTCLYWIHTTDGHWKDSSCYALCWFCNFRLCCSVLNFI